MNTNSHLRWAFIAFAAAWALVSCAFLSLLLPIMGPLGLPWLWLVVPILAAVAAYATTRVLGHGGDREWYWGAAAMVCFLFPGFMAMVVPGLMLLQTAVSSTSTSPDVLSVLFGILGVGVFALAVSLPAVFSGILVFKTLLWLLRLTGFFSAEESPNRSR